MAYQKLMTAEEFDKYLNEFKGKTKYVKGCYGQVLTKQLLDSKYKQSGLKAWFDKPSTFDKNKTNYQYLLQFTQGAEAGKWFAADCVCLQKGVLWGYRATPYPGGTPGKYGSNGVPDASTSSWYNYCTDKVKIVEKTSLKEIPQAEKGMVLYMDGHIGEVHDPKANQVLESSGRNDGVKQYTNLLFQSKYSNIEKNKLVTAWTGMGKLPWVDYSKKAAAPVQSNTSSSSTTKPATPSALGTAVALGAMNIRDQGSIAGKIIATIQKGTTVEVLEQLSNGWYKITWPAAKCGYAYTSNVGKAHYTYTSYAGTKAFNVKVQASLLNIRSGPGTEYPIKGQTKAGTIFTIVETNNEKTWGKIQNNGGWICIKPRYASKY